MEESRNAEDLTMPSQDVVHFKVTNRSSRPISLVLEPVGEVYVLGSSETRASRYVGDPTPTLSIDVGDAEIKIWEEGVGVLEIEPA